MSDTGVRDFTAARLAGAIETVRLDALNAGTDINRMPSSAIGSALMQALGTTSDDGERATDLDRAYVINGDDLRIALSRMRIKIEEPELSASVHGSPSGWQPLWAKGAPQDPAGLAAELLRQCAYPDAGIKDGVVDADICDHLPVDPEVAAMAALAPALPAVRRLKHQEAARVMRWATDRATENLPPF